MNAAKRLEKIELASVDGESVRLGELWQDQPVVLVFVRHFGCLFCREQVAQFLEELPNIRRRGAELVIVGNGREEHAEDFRETHNVECQLLVDPDLEAYRAAGLRRSFFSSVSPGVLFNGLRAWSSGERQGSTQGDPWQQGGVFVITPGNRVRFEHVSREAGDHPDPGEVISALPMPTRPVASGKRPGKGSRSRKKAA